MISDQPTSNKKYCAGIAAAEWSGKLSGGSDLIRAMQRWAGVTADGYLGPQTIRALQKKLGTPVDGVISYPSAMVKALQEWCNRQKKNIKYIKRRGDFPTPFFIAKNKKTKITY